MTVVSGEISSESKNRSLAETNARKASKESRIRYSRDFLVSLAHLSTGKGLQSRIEESVLSELVECLWNGPWKDSKDSDYERFHEKVSRGLQRNSENVELLGQKGYESCHEKVSRGLLRNSENVELLGQKEYIHKGLLRNSENVGLLGQKDSGRCHEKTQRGLLQNLHNVGLLGHSSSPVGGSPPNPQEICPPLHKCDKPYRPPHLYKNENRGSSLCLSQNEVESQNTRPDFSEVMREGQTEALQEKQKYNSIELNEGGEFMMSQEGSENVEMIKPEHSDLSENNTNSPRNCCSEKAHQLPDREENLVCSISCNEGSESLTQSISNEHTNNVPDNLLESTADGSSCGLSYKCMIPTVILGVLACVGLGNIFKPGTKEISSFMLWGDSDAQNGDMLLLPQIVTEQNDIAASSELNVASAELHPGESRTGNTGLKSLSQGNAGETDKGLTLEQSYGTSSRMRLIEASSCIQQCSVGRSARKIVTKTCKFFFPVSNKNHLLSAVSKYRPSKMHSEDSVLSSADQSNGKESQSVPNDLKPNPVSCFNEIDNLHLDICLPDEDSLITVDDFRIMPHKEMLEGNQFKADSFRNHTDSKFGINDEKSPHASNNGAQVHQGNTSYQCQPASTNYQMKFSPKNKPQNPSNQTYSTNMVQTVPTCYMQELYQVQSFPWNYQNNAYLVVPPSPGLQFYGNTTLPGTQSTAGTGYYVRWQ